MAWQATRSLLIVAALAAGPAVVAQEGPLLLSENAGGFLELEGERTLEIVDIPGRVIVRHGKPGEMRFAARKPGERDTERPVALWLDGRVLRLTPVEGAAVEPLWLEISVAPELATRIETTDAAVEVTGLSGGIRVKGSSLDFVGRMLHGPAEVEADDSDVKLVSVTDEVSVSGKGLAVRIENVDAAILDVVDSNVGLGTVRGELDLQFENADVTADGIEGAIRIDGETGTLELTNCGAGATLHLSEVSLLLRETKGAIRVETDGEVRFQAHEGPLNIRGRGSKVLGMQATGGALEIETDGAEVRLEAIEGATMLFGDRIDLEIKNSKGDMTISTTSSEVRIEKAEGKLTIDNEFGDVQITDAAKLVHVISRDGSVRVEGQKGPVQIEADGPQVEVHWKALTGSETSSVENFRGDIRASVPRNFRCTIDAQAPHGSIHTDFEELRLTDDGHFGAGVLNGGHGPAPQVKKPTLRFKAAGDLYLDGTGALADAKREGG